MESKENTTAADKKRKLVAVAMIAATLVLAIVAYIMLPDMLVVQMNAAGQASNVMPKLWALLIPMIITAVFSVIYAREGGVRPLIGAAVGVIVLVITFIFNM